MLLYGGVEGLRHRKRDVTIDTWDAFKREIKRQFYPEDVAYLTRKNMKHLKHTGGATIQLHGQLAKLGRAKVEETWCLRPSHGQAVAKSLVDYRRGDSSKPKPPSKSNQAKGGGDKGSRGYTSKEGSSKGPSGKDGKDKDKQGVHAQDQLLPM
ncbi:hypothetical protein CK203_063919 [Vitis vinifera]|uniref:Retrotransposon gag domain-containing protein n=1 Tax=Vitis vinifera TaxID=29760 RepID=A0A438FR92_VITVI|nr:hypothetical protein CK203_063919 [Vitis vinifera]